MSLWENIQPEQGGVESSKLMEEKDIRISRFEIASSFGLHIFVNCV